MSLEVGQVVEGVVTGIADFGAFVKLPNGKTGLVHISEIADAYVKDINNYLDEDDEVEVKVLAFRDGGEKISLSIRQASEDGGPEPKRKPRQSRKAFERKLSRFMKESNRKMSDLGKQSNDDR